jgi:hypothetical protein
MQQRVISWNTTKTATGFDFHVYSFGHQLATETLKRGTTSSRAIATGQAKKWTRWFKAQQRKEEAA